jgi:hypothetical protein
MGHLRFIIGGVLSVAGGVFIRDTLTYFWERYLSRLFGAPSGAAVMPELGLFDLFGALLVGMGLALIIQAAWRSRLPSNGGELATIEPPSSVDLLGVSENPIQKEQSGIYEGPHQELLFFINDHINPVFDHLNSIQDTIIDEISPNLSLAQLAKEGVFGSYKHKKISNSFEKLSGMASSPPEYVTFEEMIDAVDSIEKGYYDFVFDINQLAKNSGIEVRSHPKAGHHWELWRSGHMGLVGAYEAIKRNSKMGKLFRIARSSRWGQTVGDAHITLESQFLKPRDTEAKTPP